MMRFQLLIFLLWISCSCSTSTVKWDEVNFSLAEIQKATARTLPGGIREISTNEREYLSRYFLPNAKVVQPEYAINAPLRAYAKIVILGDRRPYQINVEVFTERRVGFRNNNREDPIFEHSGQDAALAANLAQKLKGLLIKGRDNRNLIDDFRPF